MLKSKANSRLDRDLNVYKMRTPYGGNGNYNQNNYSGQKRVEVTQSNGCCSSKKPKSTPTQEPPITQMTTPRQTAHERAHLRHDPPDPFYQQHKRIRKSQPTKQKSYQYHGNRENIHSTRQVKNIAPPNNNRDSSTQTTTQKKSSSCTIL